MPLRFVSARLPFSACGANKNIFARWLGSVINYGLVVVVLALVFGFIMQMFDNLLSSMNSDAAYSSITGSMARCC
nr:type IV secretion system protein [Klebsiella pneumoniae]